MGLFSLLLLVGCKKDPVITDETTGRDTIAVVEAVQDTLSPILKTEHDDNQTILTVDASKLPIRLIYTKKSAEEQIIVKLINYNHPKLKSFIKPEQAMNIRFNQIRMPDNTFDGPFGLELEYETKQKGEYWLVVSRNLMASGSPVGKFFLKVE